MIPIRLHILSFVALYSLYVLFAFNRVYLGQVFHQTTFAENSLLILSLVLINGCFFLGIHLLILWRLWLKILAIALLFANAGALYFMEQYQIVLNANMIGNVMETDFKESLELISSKLIAYLLVYAGFPSLFIIKIQIIHRHFLTGFLWHLVAIIVAFALLLGLVFVQFKNLSTWFRLNRDVRHQIIPGNYLYGLGKYYIDQYQSPKGFISLSSKASIDLPSDKPLVIVIIGETARAENFQLYGYQQPTNPKLSANKDVWVLPDVQSCDTSTRYSLPCMFSPLDRPAFQSRKDNYQALPSLLQDLGVDVRYRGNNFGSCKGICQDIPTTYSQVKFHQKPQNNVYCNEAECHDEILLHNLSTYSEEIENRPALLLLHMNGSHGPRYDKRYPKEFSKFTPVCRQANIRDCRQEELRNAYDNTLLYSDHVIAETIHFAQSLQRSSVVMYISDHGESLGENGLYLHGFPYALAPKQQTHVPWLIWGSQEFRNAHPIDSSCIENLTSLSHDNLFHTLAGLFGVRLSEYNAKKDIFSICG